MIAKGNLDGLDVWRALVATPVTPAAPGSPVASYGPRSDVLLHLQGPDNGFPSEGWELTAALRMGDWKIIMNQKSDNCHGSLANASGGSCLHEATGWVQLRQDPQGDWATRSYEGPTPNQTCSTAMPCLFNLRTDPLERYNVAAQNPAVVQRLVDRVNQCVGRVARGVWRAAHAAPCAPRPSANLPACRCVPAFLSTPRLAAAAGRARGWLVVLRSPPPRAFARRPG